MEASWKAISLARASSPCRTAGCLLLALILSSLPLQAQGTAPAAPTAVTAAGGTSQVALSWTASTGATTYSVYRSTYAGGEGATPYQTGVSAATWTDAGVYNGYYTYYYQVTAVNSAGESTKSAEVYAMPLSAPTGVTAKPGDTQAILSFPYSVYGAASYNLYRSATPGGEGATPYHTGITAGMGAPSYTDTGLTDGTTYYYQFTAVGTNTESAKSSEASATPGVPPPAPTALAATATSSQATLTWTASAGAATYNVYRGSSANGESGTPTSTGVTGTTYSDTNVYTGSPLYWKVTAVSAAGVEGPLSNEATATPVYAPYYLTAKPGDTTVTLTSPYSVYGATSYNVYRSLTPGGEGNTPYHTGVPAGGMNGPTFTDTGLTDGTTYYYQMTSVGNNSESSRSSEVSATPNVPPPAPTGLSVTATSSQASLSWTASTAASSYNVYRGTAAGGEGSSPYATNVNTASYTDPYVYGGTTYFYKVTAAGAGGIESTPSNEASAEPVSSPYYLSGKAGDGTATISSPYGVYGATSYNLYRSLTPGGEGNTPYHTGIPTNGYNGPSYTDTGLTNGTIYYYQMTAVGINSESAHSSEVSVTPAPAPATPGAPTISATTGQVTFTWTASAGASSYNVYRGTTPGGEGSSPYHSGITGTSLVDTNVYNGYYTYYYQVSAVGANGVESALTVELSGTPLSAPNTPTATPGNGQITLSWSGGYNGQGAQSYNLYRSTTPGGEGTTPYHTGITGTYTISYTDTAATNGTTYYYKVTAAAPNSESSPSSECSSTPNGNLPTTPTGLTATGTGSSQALLSWTAVNGAASYNLYRSSTPGGEGSYPAATGITATSTTSTYLSSGSTWYFQVSAVNNLGESARSAEASVLLLAAPTGVTPAPVSMGTNLSWSGVQGAASYNVYRGTAANGEAATAVATGITGITFSDTGLVNGTTYYYKVTAAGPNTESDRSAEVSSTPLPPPNPPAGISATGENMQVLLGWTLSPGATSYNVKRSATAGGPYTVVANLNAGQYTDTGLTNGTTYYYVVSALNSYGEGANSGEVSATPVAPPAAPTGLTATAGVAQVVLNWTGSGAPGYLIYRSTSAGGEGAVPMDGPVSGTSYTDTDAMPGVTYYYKVSAASPSGESAGSNEASAQAMGAGAVCPQ